ncbi:unnamed protein product, partial [Prorocentrum cordatum]
SHFRNHAREQTSATFGPWAAAPSRRILPRGDDIVVAVGLVAATRRPTAEEEQSLSPLVLRAAPLRWRTKRSSPPRGGGGPRAHGAAAGRAPLRSRCAPTPPARWTWSPSSNEDPDEARVLQHGHGHGDGARWGSQEMPMPMLPRPLGARSDWDFGANLTVATR